MKKMLYINFDYKNYQSKTLAQIKAFQKYKYNCYLLCLNNSKKELFLYAYNNNEMELINQYSINNSVNNKIKFHKEINNIIFNIVKNEQFNFIYVRRIGIPIIFYNFARINKISKVVYELPTFPFDKTNNFKMNLYQKIEEKYTIHILGKNIFSFATIFQKNNQKYKNMFSIYNGVDSSKVDIKKRVIHKKNKKSLDLVGIAHLNYWHGYDRVVKAIETENQLNVNFTIYSNNTIELQNLKKYVKEHNLEKRVHFDFYDGNNLINLVNKFDVAIGGIGFQRRKAEFDTSIKNKEYCLAGIPFVISCEDLAFTKDFKYIYYVDKSDNLVDLHSINDWYNLIKNENMPLEMNNYAVNNLSYYKAFYELFEMIDKDDEK